MVGASRRGRRWSDQKIETTEFAINRRSASIQPVVRRRMPAHLFWADPVSRPPIGRNDIVTLNDLFNE
jgi:hypothetical protein